MPVRVPSATVMVQKTWRFVSTSAGKPSKMGMIPAVWSVQRPLCGSNSVHAQLAMTLEVFVAKSTRVSSKSNGGANCEAFEGARTTPTPASPSVGSTPT